MSKLRRENQVIRVRIRLPKKTKEQLEWLKDHGYGSVSSIIREMGLVKDVLDMYVNAINEEEIKKSIRSR